MSEVEQVLLESLEAELKKYPNLIIRKNDSAKKLGLEVKLYFKGCGGKPCWRDWFALGKITECIGLEYKPSPINLVADFFIEFDLRENYAVSEATKILDVAKKFEKIKTYFNFYIKRTEMEIEYSIDHMFP